MIEIWKDIKDYEGYYQVSNFGKVKSLNRKIWNGKGFYISKEIILKSGITKKGYLHVVLCNEGKRKTCIIHRIVAKAFLLNSNNLPEIDHLDNDGTNNYLNNLEWVTYSENRKRMYQRDKRKSAVMKKVFQFDLNNNLITEYESSYEAERKTKIKNTNICKCCKNKRKSAGGFIWKYNK